MFIDNCGPLPDGGDGWIMFGVGLQDRILSRATQPMIYFGPHIGGTVGYAPPLSEAAWTMFIRSAVSLWARGQMRAQSMVLKISEAPNGTQFTVSLLTPRHHYWTGLRRNLEAELYGAPRQPVILGKMGMTVLDMPNPDEDRIRLERGTADHLPTDELHGRDQPHGAWDDD
jgi:hypothetical protein